jgi:hypothetical protein
MIATPELIDALATRLTPVRRLRPPVIRSGIWLALAVLVLAMLGILHGLRPDLQVRIEDPTFLLGVAAALATAVLAAVAAFLVSLPDRSRYWLALPVPPLLLWMSTIGYGCLTNWVAIDTERNLMAEAVSCFATLVMTSLPLSLALLVMLRYAVWIRPTATALAGSLAVAAFVATGLSLFHNLDATAMILIWNVGVAALIVGLGRLFGARLFRWIAPTAVRADV